MKIEMNEEEVRRLLSIEKSLDLKYKLLRKDLNDFKDMVIEWKKTDMLRLDQFEKELKSQVEKGK